MAVSGSITAVSGENRWVTLLKSECGQLKFHLSPRISTSDAEVTDGGIPLSDITMVCSCSLYLSKDWTALIFVLFYGGWENWIGKRTWPLLRFPIIVSQIWRVRKDRSQGSELEQLIELTACLPVSDGDGMTRSDLADSSICFDGPSIVNHLYLVQMCLKSWNKEWLRRWPLD